MRSTSSGNRHNRIVMVPALALAAGLTLGSSAMAQNGTWLPTSGSHSFNEPGSWVGNLPPGTSGVAIFDNNFGGTANFTAGATIAQLSLRNTANAILFDLQGQALNIGTTGPGIQVSNAASQVNDITFTGGSVSVTSGNAFNIGVSGSHGNKLTFTGAGMQYNNTATGTGSNVGPAGSNNNTLSVLNNAHLSVLHNITVGSTTSTGNSVVVNNASLMFPGGSRGMVLQTGNSLTVTNSLMTAPSSTFHPNSNVTFNSGTMGFRNTTINTGSPFVVGDGGATKATLALVFSFSSALNLTANHGIHLNSNGRLVGSNTSGAIIGNVSGVAGAQIAPSVVTGATLAHQGNFGRMNITGNLNHTNINTILQLGDFPTTLANVVPPATFTPPADRLFVNGTFTHGGEITIDLTHYVPPEDQDYEVQLMGWTSLMGDPSQTMVTFIGGPGGSSVGGVGALSSSALPYEFRSDGLYVTAQVPEPAAISLLAFMGAGLLIRRRR